MGDKDAYYFSHDSNARNDEKILAIRMRFKAEGYGVYFMILERLREESDYMSIKDYNLLAFDFRVSSDLVKSIVEDFGLFEFTDDGKHFYSKRMMRNMKIKESKSLKAKKAAAKRWGKSTDKQSDNADAMQTHSEPKALKERKVKESKVKETTKESPTDLIINEMAKYAEKCIKDRRWIIETCMSVRLDAKEAEYENFRIRLWNFCKHLGTTEKKHTSLKDFKQHFISWLRIRVKSENKKTPNHAVDATWLA